MSLTRSLTLAEQRAKTTKEFIDALMLTVVSDDVILCEVVAGGPIAWRNACAKEWPLMAFNTDICNKMFHCFSTQVIQRFGANLGPGIVTADGAPTQIASAVLDKMEPETPPTEAEINAAWEIDSASSYEAKKQLYGDDGPEGYLEKLKQGAEPHQLKH